MKRKGKGKGKRRAVKPITEFTDPFKQRQAARRAHDRDRGVNFSGMSKSRAARRSLRKYP